MKVWNKEISHCGHCGLCALEYPAEIDTIHPDCPFNKELTKEDIESFGFVEDTLRDYEEYRKCYIFPQHFTLTHLLKDIAIKITGFDQGLNKRIYLFEGTITSKPHLEFILQSLGIIQL